MLGDLVKDVGLWCAVSMAGTSPCIPHSTGTGVTLPCKRARDPSTIAQLLQQRGAAAAPPFCLDPQGLIVGLSPGIH